MKKIIFASLALGACLALADGMKIYGVITNADINTRTITLDSSVNGAGAAVLKILPNTEIDMENCGLFGWWDKSGTWEDLVPGTFVKTEIYGFNAATNAPMSVKEITIECGKKAY